MLKQFVSTRKRHQSSRFLVQLDENEPDIVSGNDRNEMKNTEGETLQIDIRLPSSSNASTASIDANKLDIQTPGKIFAGSFTR